MRPGLRKLALTAHIVLSVGWLGSVATVLVLTLTGLLAEDAHVVRGAYAVLEPLAWFALLPLALASLVSGLLQSFGTKWGLVRHYWVLAKLFINVFATVVLLAYMQTLDRLSRAAAAEPSDLDSLRSASPALHAGAALLLLLVATVLAVYKPRGLTRYGHRREWQRRAASLGRGADGSSAIL